MAPYTSRNRRTWTDEQLILAVRDARSWRGVLGNLGLYAGGPNHVVKREAARLELDTRHFGSMLRCSESDLTRALESAKSWPQLLSALGLRTESGRARTAISQRAEQLGLSTDHLGTTEFRRRRSPIGELNPHLGYLRDAAESLVMAWFLLRGLIPAVPADPGPYDFLLDTPAGVQRVQVKSTTQLAKSQSWRVGIGRHAGGGDKHNRRLPYLATEVDLFAILDGFLNLYLIPQASVAGRVEITMRVYESFRAGSAASMAPPKPGTTKRTHTIQPELNMIRAPARSGSADREARVALPTPPDGSARKQAAVRWHELRPRTRWPEDELRRVAASSKSWADMLRAFGYKPGSTRPREALRRDLQAFGIDTSHFAGRRTWTDTTLMDAAPAARTWADLCIALGLAPGTGHYESVRKAAARLGVCLDHLTMGPRSGCESLGFDLPTASVSRRLSSAAPSIAAAWFLLCGVPVSIPARPEVYDLVVHVGDGLKRVQVKSTAFRDKTGSWVIGVGHRPDGASTRADFVAYGAQDLDLFFIVDGDLMLYLIPITAVAGKASLYLRAYADFIVGDASSLLQSRIPAAAPENPTTAA